VGANRSQNAASTGRADADKRYRPVAVRMQAAGPCSSVPGG